MRTIQKDKKVSLKEIAATVDGTVVGKAEEIVVGLCSLEDPLSQHLSLFTGRSLKSLEEQLKASKISAVLVKDTLEVEKISASHNFIKVKDPVAALIKLTPLFIEQRASVHGISSKAEIDPSAKIGSAVSIGAFSSVGADVVIGDNVTIYQSVTIYPGAKIGNNVTIHSGATIRENCVIQDGCVLQNGAVIGSDGFGYVLLENKLSAVPQVGNVVLSKGVDVGANSCIDRATLGKTAIGAGAKIDNLVQIGHNTNLGIGSIVCGQAGIAGSCKIGNGVVLGGQAGIADHITIADGVRLSAKAGITGDILEKGDYAGYPARPLKSWHREVSKLASLAEKKREE